MSVILFIAFLVARNIETYSQHSFEKKKTNLPTIENLSADFVPDSKQTIRTQLPGKMLLPKLNANVTFESYVKLLDQQILELNRLLQVTKKESSRIEILLRLAEAYTEKSQAFKLLAPDHLKSNQNANSWALKSIEIYEMVLKKWPKQVRQDMLLYYLGFNYLILGQRNQFFEYYNRLVKNFPKSVYVIEAQFLLAEEYFEENQYDKALQLYEKVIAARNVRFLKFALYKRAWCLFKLNQFNKAYLALKEVLKNEINQRVNLSKEVKRDLIIFASEAIAANKALVDFPPIYGKDTNKALENLAYRYLELGKLTDAEVIFRHLVTQNVEVSRLFKIQVSLLRAYYNSKDVNHFLKLFEDALKRFDPKHSSKMGQSESDKENWNTLESMLRSWILFQHKVAQESLNPLAQKVAKSGYELYLRYFADSPHGAQMNFFYGELLYDMKQYEQASRYYRLVIEKYPGSNFAAQSAGNLLAAAFQSLPPEQELIQRAKATSEPIPMSSEIVNFIEQSQWFLKTYPQSEKSAEVAFRIGRLYYLHNQFDKAIYYFQLALERNPDDKIMEYSVNLMLDSYVLKKDFDGLQSKAQELLKNPVIRKSKIAQSIQTVVNRSRFKKAQQMQESGKLTAAAQDFEDLINQTEDLEVQSAAFFNAVNSWFKAGQWSKARMLLEKGLDKPYAKKYRSELITLLFNIYFNTGRFEQAVSLIPMLNASDKKNQANLHLLAAKLLLIQNKVREACHQFELFHELVQNHDGHIWFECAKGYWDLGQAAKARQFFVKYFVEYAHRPHPDHVWACYYVVTQKPIPGKVDFVSCEQAWRRLRAQERSTGAEPLSRVWLHNLKLQYAMLYQLPISDPDNLQRQLEAKIKVLDEMNRLSGEILKLEKGFAILEALSIIADANLNIWESIIKSPAPRQLKTPEQKEQYYNALKNADFVKKFFDNAIKGYRLVLEKAQEMELVSDATGKARSQLAKLGQEKAWGNFVVSEESLWTWHP